MDRFKILKGVEPPKKEVDQATVAKLFQIIDEIEVLPRLNDLIDPLPEIKEQTRMCRGWVPGDGCGSGRCGETPCELYVS